MRGLVLPVERTSRAQSKEASSKTPRPGTTQSVAAWNDPGDNTSERDAAPREQSGGGRF
jgi:hypothetical protein